MSALFGGILIGLAAALLLSTTGRILGISGIVSGFFAAKGEDKSWRLYFLAGILTGGVFIRFFLADRFDLLTHAHWYEYIGAGLLVGIGTTMGNGCTSGHGVCGISRFSMRSIVSTITFILFGIIGVLLAKWIRGGIL